MLDPATPDFANTPVSEARPVYGYAPQDWDATPVVSLVTPFHDEKEIFRETVASVLRQSLQQWEWIVVDDCSTSAGSQTLLEEARNQDPRIRVIRAASNGGPGAARNLGAAAARAPFLAFIDSDDLLEPTALEKWRWFLESHPQYDFVKGYQVGFGAESYLWHEGFHSGDVMLERNVVQTASMIRREVWQRAGGMDAGIRGGMEDWDFWLRCASQGSWGGTLPEYLDWYRRRPTHSDRWADWDDAHRQLAFRNRLRERYPEVFRNGVPKPPPSYSTPNEALIQSIPFPNRLGRMPGRKRILMLVPHLELGGSDKFTLDLIRQLRTNHGYDVTVAATMCGGHGWRHRYEAETPDVFTLDTILKLSDYPRFLCYLIESRDIDTVLVTHCQLGYQLLPYLRCRYPHLRCLDYVHIEEEEWKSGGYPRYSVTYQHFLDATVASSEHLRRWVVERGGDPSKVHACTTNIDPAEWVREAYEAGPLLAKFGLKQDVPVITFVGRICAQKQPHVLAGALLELHRRGLPYQAVIAGDGEDAAMLSAFVKEHGLQQVVLLGRRSNHEVREILAISDIFFLPSRMEGISLALFEAMAMGAVPVGADVGGQAELVTPETGILIRRSGNEAGEYADALASLLLDRGRRTAMRQAGRARVASGFTLDVMGSRMAAILGSLGCDVFDAGRAFTASPAMLATEIVEQRRLESLADELWAARFNHGSSGERGGPEAEFVPVLPAETWIPLLRKALIGHPLAWLKLAGRRGFSWTRLAHALSLVYGADRRENRLLLRRVLTKPAAAEALVRQFDQHYYLITNRDVLKAGLDPLLHYSLLGHLEQRMPSGSFDLRQVLAQWPELRGNGANPLLWKVLREAATK